MIYGIKTLRSTWHISNSGHVCINFFINTLHIGCALENTCVNGAFLHCRIDLHVLREGFNIYGIALFLQNRQNGLTELLLIGSDTKSNRNFFLVSGASCFIIIAASRQHRHNTNQHHYH
ncbi:hypothetical protein D3C85_1413560 [compost metagenome]